MTERVNGPVPLPRRLAAPRRAAAVLAACVLAAASAAMAEGAAADTSRRYAVTYTLRPDPASGTVHVRMDLDQDRALLREVDFSSRRIEEISGDGTLRRDDGRYAWLPPAEGGTLEWRARGRHQRGDDGYDAWLDTDFGLLRIEDVIPRAATRHLRGARSETLLRFELPPGWSVVTEYREHAGAFPIPTRDRGLTLPTGWLVMGDLGVRRELIAGTRVVVAAPVGHDVRRMDILALLNWTLPELARILPEPAPRITIVSAGEPMWRGGLSAPQSLYMHAERPLLSENATSTLLHEVVHVAMRASATRGYDWIVEGFAEYYSLELLRRSGGISLPRYRAALADLEEWGETAQVLCSRISTGPETALAVTVLVRLNAEIDELSGGKRNLDHVLHALLDDDRKVSLALLRDTVREITGSAPDSLRERYLPGCGSAA